MSRRPVSWGDAPISVKDLWPHVSCVPRAALFLSPRSGPSDTRTRLLSAHTVHVATNLSRGLVYLPSLQPSCSKFELKTCCLAQGSLDLQALESTLEKGVQGRPWTSTLTEPVQLETYFKNGNEVPGGSSQAHARRRACLQSRSPRVNGVPILEHEGLQDQGTFAALKRRRRGHVIATGRLLSALHGAEWHRGTAPPGWPAPSSARCLKLLDVFVFLRKVANDFVLTKQVTKNTPTKNHRLCPVEFIVVCVAVVTTTRSSSEC